MTKSRSFGVIALIMLFAIGTCASFLSAVSLAFPGSFLEPIWRLNPNARAGFSRLGPWAIVLMIAVCIACFFTAVGLWRRRQWGHWLAVMMLVVNLGGDVVNVVTGMEPRAVIGIPIVGTILAYLLRKQTRDHFATLRSQLREHLDAVTEIPADEITDEDLMRTRAGCSNAIQNSAAQWPSKTIPFCSVIRRRSFPGWKRCYSSDRHLEAGGSRRHGFCQSCRCRI